MMTVKQLKVVEAIGRLGSATAAAGELHVSQPAVSHALLGLERRLGAELFHREAGGMRPTPEGERVIRSARLVLSEIRAAQQDVAELARGATGTIRIATECYTCYHWLPELLRRFQEERGHERVDVVPLALDDPVSGLAAGSIDLAVLHSPPSDPELHTEEIFRDELVLVTPPDHPLAGRPYVEPADLGEERLLFHSDPAGSVVTRHFLGPANVRPAREIELRLTEAVISGVKAGMGVTTLAAWAVAPEVEGGQLCAVRLGADGIERSWYVAVRAEDRRRPALSALIDLLSEDALGTLGAGDAVTS